MDFPICRSSKDLRVSYAGSHLRHPRRGRGYVADHDRMAQDRTRQVAINAAFNIATQRKSSPANEAQCVAGKPTALEELRQPSTAKANLLAGRRGGYGLQQHRSPRLEKLRGELQRHRPDGKAQARVAGTKDRCSKNSKEIAYGNFISDLLRKGPALAIGLHTPQFGQQITDSDPH